MAKLNNVSTQKLRLYDKRNILKPEFLDEKNGYRYYHIEQCDQLDLIYTMQICGMTLNQIKNQLNEYSPDKLRNSLINQETILKQKIEQLNRHLRTVKHLESNLNKMSSLPPDGQIVMEYLPERKIDTLKTDVDLFERSDYGYEIMMREFKSYMIKHNLPLSYFFNVGTIIKKSDFKNQNYHSKTVFIFVDNNYPKRVTQQILPENMYMTLYSDNPKDEIIYAKKLFQEIQQRDLIIAGDYICEVIFNPAIKTKNRVSLKYKIQVPVVNNI
ncbi:MerR family transcriptional regulator [Companilactobacillus insicii]|uniref:MerR family transcriptional regulator n=1 Tax=Companilactobacillus insicii TaxID=1732567 RepID=UPI001B87ECBB|nr:MerR family transcriptional regulator [Companilactobacillus insicii]